MPSGTLQLHHNIPRGDLHRRRPLIIAVVAAALSLSGCIPIPWRECSEVTIWPPEIEASKLKQGAERDSAAQSSLIFGRLTIKAGNKDRTGYLWQVVAVKDDQAVGVLTEYLVSGEAYYLLVPPGEYFVHHWLFGSDTNVWFDVPREVGVYYLGTLVSEDYPANTDKYETRKADIVDEFDTAVAELRHRNPQFSGVAQRRLMRSGAPTSQFEVWRTDESCRWYVFPIPLGWGMQD